MNIKHKLAIGLINIGIKLLPRSFHNEKAIVNLMRTGIVKVPGNERSQVQLPECVSTVCNAWKAHVIATEQYNIKRKDVIERRQLDNWNYEDWSEDLSNEYHAMNDSRNAYYKAVQLMIAELTDSGRSKQ